MSRSSDSRSAAERFADAMGDAAKQLTNALLELLKEYLKKQQQDKQAQEARLKEMLKEAGLETSPDNMEKLNAYLDNARKAQGIDKELADVKLEIDALGPRDQLSATEITKHQDLFAKQDRLLNERAKLGDVDKLPDLAIDETRQKLKAFGKTNGAVAGKERMEHGWENKGQGKGQANELANSVKKPAPKLAPGGG